MNKVSVLKTDLLTTVEANMAHHREVYEQAMVGYQKAAVTWLQNCLQTMRSGETSVRLVFVEPMPEDHTDDYERVAAMINWSVDEHIELTASEFSQYVLDDWGWKRQWVATTSNYLAS